MEFEEREAPAEESELAAAFGVVLLVFGEAAKVADRNQKRKLYDVREMLKRKEPLQQVVQAIFEAMGPTWVLGPEVMKTVEDLKKKKE